MWLFPSIFGSFLPVKSGNYAMRCWCRDLRLRLRLRPDAEQRLLELWAVGCQTEAENRAAENPIRACEARRENRIRRAQPDPGIRTTF